MINLNDLTLGQLEDALQSIGEPKYRAGQLFKWFARGVTDPDDMSDLSKPLREKLFSSFGIAPVTVEQCFASKADDTKKYLLRLSDGNLIESVAMHYKHGLSVCISTQVGCLMGCEFCASTLSGRVRNLTAGEILGQVAALQRALSARVSNIVLMGIGEPLDNFGNVVTFLKNVNHPQGMNIGYRHISLSTCGIADRIYDLAKQNMPITLSVSLHAPNDGIRSRIMPVNKKYPVAVLMAACREYVKATNRRISFEYILIDGLNDSLDTADELAGLLRNLQCHVNLIPANFVPESGLKKSCSAAVAAFKKRLELRRINVTVRRELGADIDASCGQLRQRHSG